MKSELQQVRNSPSRIGMVILALLGLVLTYLSQDYLVLKTFLSAEVNVNTAFIFKKTLRVLLNDSFMLLFIYAWFNDQKVTRLALWIQIVDTMIFLPAYLLLKLSIEGDSEISSPLLSQLHRLIVNPTLMILLIPAIYFQRYRKI